MYSPSGHPRCRWVCFFTRTVTFMSSYLYFYSTCTTATIFGEIICSPMDLLQRMGAVRMRVQTGDKNITIIHSTPSVNVLRSKNMCVCNKQIHQASSCCFQLKYEYFINNIDFSFEKVVSSESGDKSAQLKYRLQVKTIQNSS